MKTPVAIKSVTALIIVSAVALCASFAAETNAIPESFRTSIGGFLGTTYSVEFRGGVLYYSAANGPKTHKVVQVTPSARQWREFRHTLNVLGLSQWHTNYPNPGGVYDGTQWSVEIHYADLTLNAKGSNNFPGHRGKPSGSPSPTKPFLAYTAAVSKLLGGKEFQ